jgi:hypothetical protein
MLGVVEDVGGGKVVQAYEFDQTITPFIGHFPI